LPELDELAADLRFDVVRQQCTAIPVGKRDLGAALGKSRDPTVSLARDAVAVGGSSSENFTFPFQRALTGPILIVATAWNSLCESLSSDSQPGMQLFSTAASLSIAHTASRLAGSWTSPIIFIAIEPLLSGYAACNSAQARITD
jgi:hypothetical protein